MGFKEMRERSGKTVISVADALGVSREAVYCWENGKYYPEASKLKDVAKLYRCTVDDLLRNEKEQANGKEVSDR